MQDTANDKKTPQRHCMGCNGEFPKNALLRVCKSKTGIEIDLFQKKEGRGAYICYNESCHKRILKNKRLQRVFKTAVSDDIFTQLLTQIQKRGANE